MWLPICKLQTLRNHRIHWRQSTTELWHFITNFGFLFFRSTWTPRNHRIHWRRDYSTGPNCDLSLQGCRRKSIGRDIMVQVRIKNISTCFFMIIRYELNTDFKSSKKLNWFQMLCWLVGFCFVSKREVTCVLYCKSSKSSMSSWAHEKQDQVLKMLRDGATYSIDIDFIL